MKRPQPGEYGDFYQGYIDRTRGADVLQNLEDSADMLLNFLEDLPEEKRDYAYGEDKWTIRQMLQHLIDAELVFTYRALWIARGGDVAVKGLPGFHENTWAENSLKALPPWDEMIEQFKALRNYSMALFHSFPESLQDKAEQINDYHTTLRSIPFIIAGHTFHHLHILKTRYL